MFILLKSQFQLENLKFKSKIYNGYNNTVKQTTISNRSHLVRTQREKTEWFHNFVQLLLGSHS